MRMAPAGNDARAQFLSKGPVNAEQLLCKVAISQTTTNCKQLAVGNVSVNQD